MWWLPEMIPCEFQYVGRGRWQCDCGRSIKAGRDADPSRMHAICRLGPQPTPAEFMAVVHDPLDCVHRGPGLGQIKVECRTAEYAEYFACGKHKRCLKTRPPREEPERSLFKVCANCRDRERPPPDEKA